MNAEEKAELNRTMAATVMGWIYHQEKPCRKGVETSAFAMWSCGSTSRLVSDWNPCENPADAFAVLKACMHHHGAIRVHKIKEDEWQVHALSLELNSLGVIAETLELAICRFAQSAFKPTTEGA